MKNLKITLLIPCLLVAGLSYGQWGKKSIKGNGNVTTITRTTSDYNGVRCGGFMDFKLVEGEEGKITLEGESNLLEHIITEVKDGSLIVKVAKGKNLKPSKNKPLIITIPYKDIEYVSLAGSGDVWNEGTIEGAKLSASLAGSGDIILNINTDKAKASVAGSGDLTLKGTTKDLQASVAGSGDYHGFKLEATNVDVSVAGSGDADVVCNGALKARVSGSGDIEYRGNPTKEDTRVAGSGSISN